jgi:predicted transcriptional regulator YdeE
MAKDIFHDAVKQGLLKDGWTITHDSYTINIPEFRPKQDIGLGAEKMLAAEKGIKKIAVEIKSFIKTSVVYDFHAALGQYMNYLIGIGIQEPDRLLYLAIPEHAYLSFENMGLIWKAIETYNVRLIVYDSKKEIVVTWKN